MRSSLFAILSLVLIVSCAANDTEQTDGKRILNSQLFAGRVGKSDSETPTDPEDPEVPEDPEPTATPTAPPPNPTVTPDPSIPTVPMDPICRDNPNASMELTDLHATKLYVASIGSGRPGAYSNAFTGTNKHASPCGRIAQIDPKSCDRIHYSATLPTGPLPIDYPLQIPISLINSLKQGGYLSTAYVKMCGLDKNENPRCVGTNGGTNKAKLSKNGISFSPQTLVVWNKLWDSKNVAANERFCRRHVSSPLVLNLTGKPIVLSPPSVRFDLNADGKKDLNGWVTNPEDAFLALDLDHDGEIGSGAELFGNATKLPNNETAANGFIALAQYDQNDDKKITATDAIFSTLRLWKDYNLNGETDYGELKTLDRERVVSISVDYVDMDETDQFGNKTMQRALFEMIGGVFRVVFDLWFRTIQI